MTELEKYKLINRCETFEELKEAILKLADEGDMIEGRSTEFSARTMADNVERFQISPNYLTRSYGIRQQAFYIQWYINQHSWAKNIKEL